MRRICLFAHFDTTGRIAPHVRHYLRQLHMCGFGIHVALSGTERLHDSDRAELGEIGAVAHLRENSGLDFGAWQELISKGCADGADRILLANDSVFGPFQPLAPIFETMEKKQSDIWGMAESREGTWHLQSWFLCLTAQAFSSPAIIRVLQQPFRQMTKAEIVLHGELGLGVAIKADNLKWEARAKLASRRLRRLVPGNPMHLDYLSVIRDGSVPFVKVELLRDNPAGIAWVDRWREVVATSSIFPEAWIDQHLPDISQRCPNRPRQSWQMRLLYAAITRDRRDALRALLN